MVTLRSVRTVPLLRPLVLLVLLILHLLILLNLSLGILSVFDIIRLNEIENLLLEVQDPWRRPLFTSLFTSEHLHEIVIQRLEISVPPRVHDLGVNLLKTCPKFIEERADDFALQTLQDLQLFGLEFVGGVLGIWRLLARGDVGLVL